MGAFPVVDMQLTPLCCYWSWQVVEWGGYYGCAQEDVFSPLVPLPSSEEARRGEKETATCDLIATSSSSDCCMTPELPAQLKSLNMRIVYDQYLLCSLVLSPTLKIHAGEIRLWWRVLNSKDREPYCCWWQKSSVGTWSLFPPLASQILTPLNLAVVYLSRRASQDLAQLFWLSCPPCVFSMITFNNLFQAVMCKSPIECQRVSFYGSCFNNHMVMFLLIPFCNQSCDFDRFNLMTI